MTDGQNEARDADELTREQRRSLKIIDKNYRSVNRQRASRMERISDTEMVMTGLSEPIVHIPHFQAREDIERPGMVLFFDTFFEHDRLGNGYGDLIEFTRSDIERIVAGLSKWLGRVEPATAALHKHAEWIYDHVYSSVDIDGDEGGEYIGVGCCLSELFEDLTKLLTPIILKAYHDREDLSNEIDNRRTIVSPVTETIAGIRTRERADCVTKIVEWLKR